MLEALFGNKNVQNILIFLFVNGKCYGTELHRKLKTPLTPIQKALNRLEVGGVISSYYEGKTRLYRFNPAFPLLEELEPLLKKAYTLLPTQIKRGFYVVEEDRKSSPTLQASRSKLLFAFWEKLQCIRRLTFHAKSNSKEELGWNGKGQGEVAIVKEGSTTLIFNEKGSWQNREGSEFSFSNVFRWTLDRHAGAISLEHLRLGLEHPVFLFHLAPKGKYTLASVDSHLCGGDCYFGKISVDRFGLKLSWRVIGPKKNEEIDYFYA